MWEVLRTNSIYFRYKFYVKCRRFLAKRTNDDEILPPGKQNPSSYSGESLPTGLSAPELTLPWTEQSCSGLHPRMQGLPVPGECSQMQEVVTDGITLPRHVDQVQIKPWMLLTSMWQNDHTDPGKVPGDVASANNAREIKRLGLSQALSIQENILQIQDAGLCRCEWLLSEELNMRVLAGTRGITKVWTVHQRTTRLCTEPLKLLRCRDQSENVQPAILEEYARRFKVNGLSLRFLLLILLSQAEKD